MTKTPELQKLLNDWLAFAKENLLYAKDGIKADFSPYHTICFLCQGSAEKYLKAYLISQGWELEKIHDLRKLLEYAVKYDSSFSEIFPETGIINRYIAEGRYPGDLLLKALAKTKRKKPSKRQKQLSDLFWKN
jgi:HEPN domain-containing protein